MAAAVALSRAGLATLIVEAEDSPGGGARTQELTLPEFKHDVCSTVHPLAVSAKAMMRLLFFMENGPTIAESAARWYTERFQAS